MGRAFLYSLHWVTSVLGAVFAVSGELSLLEPCF